MNEIIFLSLTLFISLLVFFAAKWCKEALIALAGSLWLLANLFVTKQITLFTLEVTASDAYVIGGTFATALLAKRYGKKTASSATWICFSILGAFALLSWTHLLYAPNHFDQTQSHFAQILTPMPRLTIASLIAYLLSQNSCIFLSKYLHTLPLLIVVQAIDTLVFAFLGLYGLVDSLLQVIVFSMIIKITGSLITVPLARHDEV